MKIAERPAPGLSPAKKQVHNDTDLIRSLRGRARWPWVREFLKIREFKPGHGWETVVAMLKGGDEKSASLQDLLKSFYQDIVLAGNRYIQIFEMPAGFFEKIKGTLQNTTIPETKYSNHFPYLLTEDELLTAPPELTLCEVIPDSEGYILAFCSRQDYTEKQVFEGEAAALISKRVPTLEGYDSIIALKTKSFQAIDIVAIRPKLNRVEVMVDLPLSHAQGLDRQERTLKILTTTALHIPEFKKIYESQFPENIFPAISEVYKDKKAGKLQEIKFRTAGGLVDNLKTIMPDCDLRIDAYHSNGAKAIPDQIELFEVVTRLELTMPPADLTLRIASNAKTLANAPDSRTLYGFELLECLSQRDAVRAVNKVVSYIST